MASYRKCRNQSPTESEQSNKMDRMIRRWLPGVLVLVLVVVFVFVFVFVVLLHRYHHHHFIEQVQNGGFDFQKICVVLFLGVVNTQAFIKI